jgi:hypothetical protein
MTIVLFDYGWKLALSLALGLLVLELKRCKLMSIRVIVYCIVIVVIMQVEVRTSCSPCGVGVRLADAHALHDKCCVQLWLEYDALLGAGFPTKYSMGGVGTSNQAPWQVCSASDLRHLR